MNTTKDYYSIQVQQNNRSTERSEIICSLWEVYIFIGIFTVAGESLRAGSRKAEAEHYNESYRAVSLQCLNI